MASYGAPGISSDQLFLVIDGDYSLMYFKKFWFLIYFSIALEGIPSIWIRDSR